MKKSIVVAFLGSVLSATGFADCSTLIARHKAATQSDISGQTFVFATLDGWVASQPGVLLRRTVGVVTVSGQVLQGHLTFIEGARDVACSNESCVSNSFPSAAETDVSLTGNGILTLSSHGQKVTIPGTCNADSDTWQGTLASATPNTAESENLVLILRDLIKSRD